MMKHFFLFTLLFCFGFWAKASSEFYEYNKTVRQAGMGGVYVFRDDDASSFLQNPAYTCFTEGVNWTIFNMNLGSNGYSIYDDIGDFKKIDGINSLKPYYGKEVYIGVGANTTLTLPCFGVSYWLNGAITLLATNPPFPRLEVSYINDQAFQMGGAFKLSDNTSVGATIRRITRLGGDQVFDADLLTNINTDKILDSFNNTGRAWAADVGIVTRLSKQAFNPTLSIAWKDVGRTRFLRTKGLEAPQSQSDNLTMGLTFNAGIPGFSVEGGLEYRHITDTESQLGKKLHMGLELGLPFFDVRAGFNQGYTTYGFGMDLFFFQLDAAMYSVETGAYPGQKEDERLQIGLSFEMGFDPDFKLTNYGGKKRKLKQRR
ncbi:MAG: hypothetical protein LW875_09515 [Proteobacteria bacterium]|jgi:hypothetical protein|nr:hypothetical protein [Pseudomonadota bacterium]